MGTVELDNLSIFGSSINQSVCIVSTNAIQFNGIVIRCLCLLVALEKNDGDATEVTQLIFSRLFLRHVLFYALRPLMLKEKQRVDEWVIVDNGVTTKIEFILIFGKVYRAQRHLVRLDIDILPKACISKDTFEMQAVLLRSGNILIDNERATV